MNVRIRNTKDFYAGIIFIFFGCFVLVEARGYQVGTASQMGPGYFPMAVGWLILLLGVIIAIRGLWGTVEPIGIKGLGHLLLVCAGVVAFGLIVRPLGLVLAVFALVFISSFASRECRVREVFGLFLVLLAMAIGIFVFGLGLPFNLIGSR